ncbi:EAL domain-containing protein, partial [Aduncisulcus paluster]
MVNKDRSVFVSELSFHSFEMLGIEEHLILLRDITEMKKQKHQLSIFELIFKNSYEAMFITNHDEVIQWANKSCANLYGYAPDEMVGLPTRALGSGLHDKPFFEEMWKTLSASGGWSGEIWNKTKKGELIPVHQSIIHIPGNDP